MHFEISRGFKSGRLTPAQRNSSLFSEEPVIAGKVLRRGMKPLTLTPAQFELAENKLKQLFKAGAIDITVVDMGQRIELRKYEKNASSRHDDPVPESTTGDDENEDEGTSPETGETSTEDVAPVTVDPSTSEGV